MVIYLANVNISIIEMGYSYVIRNYHPKDLDGIIGLINQTEKLEPAEHYISIQTLSESLGKRQDYSPEKDMFTAKLDNNIVGFINIIPELNIGRVILTCLVHPKYRRMGLGRELFRHAIRHAKKLKVKTIQTNISSENIAAEKFLSKLEFRLIRLYLELSLQLSNFREPSAKQLSKCRHLRLGEEDKLTHLQNRSFAGTWGYNPNSLEEISYRINLPNYSRSNIIVAHDKGRLVGYCWTQTDIGEKRVGGAGVRKGRIYMLGVDPDHRCRGIGRMALLAGLNHLKSRGCKVVDITVDSENEAANLLYRSIGFKLQGTSLWYEKMLD